MTATKPLTMTQVSLTGRARETFPRQDRYFRGNAVFDPIREALRAAANGGAEAAFEFPANDVGERDARRSYDAAKRTIRRDSIQGIDVYVTRNEKDAPVLVIAK